MKILFFSIFPVRQYITEFRSAFFDNTGFLCLKLYQDRGILQKMKFFNQGSLEYDRFTAPKF